MHQTEKCGLTMSRNFSKGARIISLDEFVLHLYKEEELNGD